MIKGLSNFFKGPGQENSSKRLVGILAGIILIYLAFRGGETFLSLGKSDEFLKLFEIFCYFVAAILGLGLADHCIKK